MASGAEVSAPGGAPAPRLEPPPLSLYVHVPWCERKCPYCDFNSHALRAALPEREYCAALVADLQGELPNVWGRRVRSVYVGGGTPSLLSAAAVDGLLADIRALLPLAPDAEVTLEANPGTFGAAKARDLRAAGVGRVSVGAQSFDDGMLARIGRVHDGAQARRAVEHALAHVGNVNVDLMHALPGQDVAQALRDTRLARELGPPHISAYHLAIEPGTAFARRPPPSLPDHDRQADISEAVAGDLGANGWAQYEISAFCRPGAECAHNLNYWAFGDYVGIGCGAHGKLTGRDGIVRTERVRSPGEYMRRCLGGEPPGRRWSVPPADRVFEYALNAFRVRKGFDLGDLARRCGGECLGPMLGGLAEARRLGLAERDGPRVRATDLGWRHMNGLLALFMPPE